MQLHFDDRKETYSPPSVKRLTPEQARKFVVDRANCSEQEAEDFLESLRREWQQNDQHDDGKRKNANVSKLKRSA
jgi:hypothetical protein